MAKCDMATAEGCVAFGCANIGYCKKHTAMDPHAVVQLRSGMSLDEMRAHEQDAIVNRTLGIGIQKIMTWQQAGGLNNAG